jgi:hypothetical protein
MKNNHLSIIQSTVQRMGNNSFLLKGWAVLIIVAIFTFAGEQNNVRCILFTVIPLLVFWGLDTYYLQLERKYRMLYDEVRLKKEEEVDFDMNFNNVATTVGNANKISYFKCLFSKTEVLFYLTCIVTTVLIYLFA